MSNTLGAYEPKVHRSTYFYTPNLQVEFHFHTYVSLLIVGVMKAQDVTRKHLQPIVCIQITKPCRNQNSNSKKLEALIMMFALHKFRHYLLGNKFVFYVDHMALVNLVLKP